MPPPVNVCCAGKSITAVGPAYPVPPDWISSEFIIAACPRVVVAAPPPVPDNVIVGAIV